MGKLLKIVGGLLVLVVLVVVGLNIFIKSYLTNERVKTMVIPPAEKALGRTVTIGEIEVSLFSGITINNFAIKEKDGKTNFVHSRAFKISYDLMPLLHKKLEVNEIILDSPSIRVVRNKAGKFNFNSLPKGAAKSESGDATGKSAAAALPIALSVNRIRIAKAKISFRDAKKEIPDTDISADLTLKVHLGRDFDLTKLDFQGHLKAQVDALYGKIKPQAKIKADFDAQQISYTVDTIIGPENAVLQGKVDNYMAKPDILLDINSKNLNLDYLAALGAAIPPNGKKVKTEAKINKPGKSRTAIADSLPAGLHAHGTIKIDKALYKKLIINNFILPYELKDGVLTIQGMAAKTAGGQVKSNMRLDLRKPDPAYKGDLQMEAVRIETLGSGLGQNIANMINGQLKTNIDFDGIGFEPDKIKKTLNSKASYALLDGRIGKSQMTEKIASIVGLPELKTIAFKDLSGNVKVKKGKIVLSSVLHNDDFSVSTTEGAVDMSGKMNMPVLIRISAAMAKRMKGGGVSKFLADEQGNINLHIKVRGPYDHPQVSLDEKSVKKQAQKAVKKRAIQEIEKALNKNGSDKNAPAVQLLKGLFGQ